MSTKEEERLGKRSWVVLLLAVVLHVGLALPAVTLRRDIFHDEAITLLEITGHQAEYNKIMATATPPHLAWGFAGDVHRLLAMPAGPPPELSAIARDLGQFDIHPPLYFWLFSFVARMFGSTPAVGLGINVVLDCFTILVTYLLGKRVLRSERGGALAAMLWAISPGPLEACLEMRQYALLGLLVSLFALLALPAFESKSRFRFLHACALTTVCALGMLTHYHFLLLVIALGVVIAASLGGAYADRMQSRRWLLPLRNVVTFVGAGEMAESAPYLRKNAFAFAISALGGIGIGLASHPYVSTILHRQGSQAQPFKWLDIGVRLGGILVGMGRFFVWSVPFIVLWMVVLVVAGLLAIRAPKGSLTNVATSLDMPARRILLGLGLAFGAQVVLFLTFRSPAGAMRAKYLVLEYSLMACVVAGFLLRIARSRPAVPIIASVMLLSSLIAVGAEIRRSWQIDSSKPIVVSARRIVFDTVARGSLPAALQNVPPEKPVLVATPGEFLAQQDHFVSNLEPGTLVVVDAQRGSAEGRATMLQALSKRFRCEESRLAVFGERVVYTLHEKAPAVP